MVIAIVVIDQNQFVIVHFAEPLHQLDEVACTSECPIGE
jgi:hypothetical protein